MKYELVGWFDIGMRYNVWDDMWNVVHQRVSRETLSDGVASVYLDIGDVWTLIIIHTHIE